MYTICQIYKKAQIIKNFSETVFQNVYNVLPGIIVTSVIDSDDLARIQLHEDLLDYSFNMENWRNYPLSKNIAK